MAPGQVIPRRGPAARTASVHAGCHRDRQRLGSAAAPGGGPALAARRRGHLSGHQRLLRACASSKPRCGKPADANRTPPSASVGVATPSRASSGTAHRGVTARATRLVPVIAVAAHDPVLHAERIGHTVERHFHPGAAGTGELHIAHTKQALEDALAYVDVAQVLDADGLHVAADDAAARFDGAAADGEGPDMLAINNKTNEHQHRHAD